MAARGLGDATQLRLDLLDEQAQKRQATLNAQAVLVARLLGVGVELAAGQSAQLAQSLRGGGQVPHAGVDEFAATHLLIVRAVLLLLERMVQLRQEAHCPPTHIGIASVQRDVPQRVDAKEGQIEHQEVARVLLHEALLFPVDPPEKVLDGAVADRRECPQVEHTKAAEEVLRSLHIERMRRVHARRLQPAENEVLLLVDGLDDATVP